MERKIPKILIDKGYRSYDQIYRKYRSDFLRFGARYGLKQEQLIDLYQDAYIVFYEKCNSGKIKAFSSSAKTYIFAVGKNLIFNELKNLKKMDKTELDPNIPDIENNSLDEMILSERQSKILSDIKLLGESCQQVLLAFYYDQLSIKEIMVKMNYKSENVTKSKKSQCIKKLRTKLKNDFI